MAYIIGRYLGPVGAFIVVSGYLIGVFLPVVGYGLCLWLQVRMAYRIDVRVSTSHNMMRTVVVMGLCILRLRCAIPAENPWHYFATGFATWVEAHAEPAKLQLASKEAFARHSGRERHPTLGAPLPAYTAELWRANPPWVMVCPGENLQSGRVHYDWGQYGVVVVGSNCTWQPTGNSLVINCGHGIIVSVY